MRSDNIELQGITKKETTSAVNGFDVNAVPKNNLNWTKVNSNLPLNKLNK